MVFLHPCPCGPAPYLYGVQRGTIQRLIILGTVAILGIVGMQTYWVVTTWDLNETEFSQKAQLALYGVARQLAAENNAELPTRDIVRQRSSNYFIVNTESEIRADRLEYLLQQELVRLNLDIDFEYAIFNCSTNQMAYGGYCYATTDDLFKSEASTTYLPPDPGLLYYFGIKFPTRTGYIWEKMQLVIFLSIILLTTVAFFAYSLIVILRQRRLATMQKDFIDNMTHEFKTPLSTIRIAASVFQRDARIQADGRLSRYARLIHEQYERLNGQVEKVLQIARIEKNNFELKQEPVDLLEVLPPVLDGIRARLEDEGGELHCHLPQQSVYLMADPLHLSNVVHNLLDNAVKYAGGAVGGAAGAGEKAAPLSPGEPTRVTCDLRTRHGKAYLHVSDNGPGITPEHREHLFEKFYRVPTGDVHDVKGFGLGLFYVAQVCKRQGWKIDLKSEPGRGSTFILTFPLWQQHASSTSKTTKASAS